jgi:hypothetical protein
LQLPECEHDRGVEARAGVDLDRPGRTDALLTPLLPPGCRLFGELASLKAALLSAAHQHN